MTPFSFLFPLVADPVELEDEAEPAVGGIAGGPAEGDDVRLLGVLEASLPDEVVPEGLSARWEEGPEGLFCSRRSGGSF